MNQRETFHESMYSRGKWAQQKRHHHTPNSIFQREVCDSQALNRKGLLQNRIIEMHTGKTALRRPQVILNLPKLIDSRPPFTRQPNVTFPHRCHSQHRMIERGSRVARERDACGRGDMNLMQESRCAGEGEHSWRQRDTGTFVLSWRPLSLHFQQTSISWWKHLIRTWSFRTLSYSHFFPPTSSWAYVVKANTVLF